jgi:membrane-associated phospholipid phosphatase
LIVLAVQRDSRLLKAVLVPAVSFVLLSLYRRWNNAKRPYEVLDIQPLIQKDTKGKSFPSRHVFSVFVIAMTFLWLKPWLGVVFLAAGVLLAACRVIGGVHWVKDVVVGALAGIVAGLVGFW